MEPHPAAGGHHGLPVKVGEHLHDGVDEGLLDVMRETSLLLVSLPLVSLIATLRPGKFRGLTSGELWTPKDFRFFRAPKDSLRWVLRDRNLLKTAARGLTNMCYGPIIVMDFHDVHLFHG